MTQAAAGALVVVGGGAPGLPGLAVTAQQLEVVVVKVQQALGGPRALLWRLCEKRGNSVTHTTINLLNSADREKHPNIKRDRFSYFSFLYLVGR